MKWLIVFNLAVSSLYISLTVIFELRIWTLGRLKIEGKYYGSFSLAGSLLDSWLDSFAADSIMVVLFVSSPHYCSN